MKPHDCLRNSIESGYPPKETTGTIIQYGNRSEIKCEASLYISDDTGKGVQNPPKLKSSLITSDFDFTFISEVSEKKDRKLIKYIAFGRAASFKIGGLTNIFNDPKKEIDIKVLTKWETKGKGMMLFVPGLDEAQKASIQSIQVSPKTTILEQQIQVVVFDANDKSLAKGSVSAYIPSTK